TEPGLPPAGALGATVAAAVAEFRSRTRELAQEHRTRAELDRIGREIWSRLVGETQLPVRAVHAAQSLRFLRPPAAVGEGDSARPSAASGEEDLALLSSGTWLRLRTPYGSIAVRRVEAGLGSLDVSVR
ncbi:hypothetical protein ACFWOI_02710, partial [Streptomyces sp. NPDC058424]